MTTLETSIVVTIIISLYILFIFQAQHSLINLQKNTTIEMHMAQKWANDSDLIEYTNYGANRNVQTQPERLIALLDLAQDLARISKRD